MMKRLLLAGLLLSALLVVSAQAGAAKPQPNKVKQTVKPIWTLAMDGPRVAYASGGRVYVWNVVTGATSVVKGVYAKNPSPSSLGNYAPVAASEIAIAGKRVAWLRLQEVGNTELFQWLYTATPGGWAHLLRKVLGYRDIGCLGADGSQTGGVVGSGSVLAVSTWKANGHLSTTSSERLNLITAKGLRAIGTGVSTIVSASADSGHIAVLPLWTLTDPATCGASPPTSIALYGTDGKLIREIETGPAGAIELSGNLLVVRTATTPPVFKVYNWKTGTVLHTWPVARWPVDFAVAGQFAVYSVDTFSVGRPQKLHLLSLATGEDVVVATTRNSLYRNLALDQRGLVYAVNHWDHSPLSGPSSGKLVFVPMAKLLTALSK
jgi:hypothetical protein